MCLEILLPDQLSPYAREIEICSLIHFGGHATGKARWKYEREEKKSAVSQGWDLGWKKKVLEMHRTNSAVVRMGSSLWRSQARKR